MNKPGTYKVSALPGAPNLDSLPVAKITDYPLEPRDYKPFAQCILCTGGGRLHLRLWAFEVSPPPTSALACVLYPWPERPERALLVRIAHGEGDAVTKELRLLEHGRDKPPDAPLMQRLAEALESHPHNGEDLQGVYWGMVLRLPLDLLEELGGETALTPGNNVPGNFYKTCDDPRFAHRGSYFPADFPEDPYGPGSMGDFQVVSY